MKQIIFEADIAEVRTVRSRNVLKIVLEMDKAFLNTPGMKETHHDLVDCEVSDDSFKIMIVSKKDAKALAEHAASSNENVTEEIVSDGIPWKLTDSPMFALFIESLTGETLRRVNTDDYYPKELRQIIKNHFKVRTTKAISQDKIDKLIAGFNGWLKTK